MNKLTDARLTAYPMDESALADRQIRFIDDQLAMLAALKQSQATRKYTAPFTVVGFKGGYHSELAAIQAARSEGARVEDANGLTVWVPKVTK